jgi:hypothetical protein
MLDPVSAQHTEGYSVYYVVFGSLAGDGQIYKEYLWDGTVYTNIKAAISHAHELSAVQEDDPSFIVKPYRTGTTPPLQP